MEISSKNRNKPCSCGSNKKTKHCCGSVSALAEAARLHKEEERRLLEEKRAALRREREENQRKHSGGMPFTYRRNSLPMMAVMAACIGLSPR